MATLQNSTYFKIVSAAPETYDLIPFDINGNLFREITVNIDTTGGAVTLNLPEIVDLPNYNLLIKVVRSGGGNNVVVTAGGSDKIGSASTVTLNAINKSVEVSPIGAINWYGVITA
jgi:hypothetical protein